MFGTPKKYNQARVMQVRTKKRPPARKKTAARTREIHKHVSVSFSASAQVPSVLISFAPGFCVLKFVRTCKPKSITKKDAKRAFAGKVPQGRCSKESTLVQNGHLIHWPSDRVTFLCQFDHLAKKEAFFCLFFYPKHKFAQVKK